MELVEVTLAEIAKRLDTLFWEDERIARKNGGTTQTVQPGKGRAGKNAKTPTLVSTQLRYVAKLIGQAPPQLEPLELPSTIAVADIPARLKGIVESKCFSAKADQQAFQAGIEAMKSYPGKINFVQKQL
jgi:hypothetical protein